MVFPIQLLALRVTISTATPLLPLTVSEPLIGKLLCTSNPIYSWNNCRRLSRGLRESPSSRPSTMLWTALLPLQVHTSQVTQLHHIRHKRHQPRKGEDIDVGRRVLRMARLCIDIERWAFERVLVVRHKGPNVLAQFCDQRSALLF